MENNFKYYLYLIFGLNLLANLLLVLNSSEEMQLVESAVFSFMIFATFYLVYNFETRKEKPYMETMIFFSLITLNAIIAYFITGIFNIAFVALLNVLGIYITAIMIPNGAPDQKVLITKDEEYRKPNYFKEKMEKPAYVQPLHSLKTNEILPIDKKKYIERELDEIEKEAEDIIYESAEEVEKDLYEDTPIVIEEIKPTVEPDIHKRQAKKHIPARNIAKKSNFVEPLHELKENEILPIDKVEAEEKKIIKELDKIEKKVKRQHEKDDSEIIIEEIKARKEPKISKKKTKKKR